MNRATVATATTLVLLPAFLLFMPVAAAIIITALCAGAAPWLHAHCHALIDHVAGKPTPAVRKPADYDLTALMDAINEAHDRLTGNDRFNADEIQALVDDFDFTAPLPVVTLPHRIGGER